MPSAWIDDLNEKPDGRRKFTSVTIDLSPNLVVVQRETYDLLTWLGDVGGIADALYLLGNIILMPFTAYSFQSNLLSRMFRLLP